MIPRHGLTAAVALTLSLAGCKSENPNTCSNGAPALMCDGREMVLLAEQVPTPTLHFTRVDVLEGGCASPYCRPEMVWNRQFACTRIEFVSGALPNPTFNGSTACRFRALSAEGPSVEIALEHHKQAAVYEECCCTGTSSDRCAPALRAIGNNSWKVIVNGVLVDADHSFASILQSTVDAGVPTVDAVVTDSSVID